MKVIVFLLKIVSLGLCFVEISSDNYLLPSRRCINPNQRPGTCVSIFDCQTILSILKREHIEPFDTEFVKASQCYNDYNTAPQVCCTSDTSFASKQNYVQPFVSQDYFEYSQFAPTVVGFPLNKIQPISSTSYLRHRTDRTEARKQLELPTIPICGGVTIETKIYGGKDADLYEFPWMVLLEYKRKSGTLSTNCAGSLINERYVLTAAHCVKGAIEKRIGPLVSIRVGEYNTKEKIDCNQLACAAEAFQVPVEHTKPHELYKESSTNKEHDIALVRLNRIILFSDKIKPICLPFVVQQSDLGLSTQYTVAGWGRTLRNSSSTIKQKLNVTLVDQQQCHRKFLERKVNIVASQLCAGGKYAEDSCEGDSGGPLMRFQSGAWVLEGIVSFGFKCGLKNWPAVYTRVISYADWIRKSMR
ncbi:serine protease 7-like [Teleopsis dalmanni]|uniref:serine protease 7 n=1 Tax=Teleopsis dalmanni TaxID=139649 RepID=UPI0018CED065|nr:serine protease 7 [Teleopsis dalmanni]XP_037955721.1 serine protease 7-like [Teleopsis dalmanni]